MGAAATPELSSELTALLIAEVAFPFIIAALLMIYVYFHERHEEDEHN